MKISTLMVATTICLGGAVFAKNSAPAPKEPLARQTIDQRQTNQQKRIAKDAASGQLKPKEGTKKRKHLHKQKKASKAVKKHKKKNSHKATLGTSK
jgi:uncharacterized membrane protein